MVHFCSTRSAGAHGIPSYEGPHEGPHGIPSYEPDEAPMKAMFKITDDARFFPGDSRQDRFDRAHENYKSTCQNSRQSCRNPRHVVVDKHFVFDLLLLWCFSRSKERSAH